MPGNNDLPDDDAELLRLEAGGGLKARTLQDRLRHMTNFKEYIAKEMEGGTLEDLIQDEVGRKRLDFLVGKFFNTMTVVAGVTEEGEPVSRKPKLGYALKIHGCTRTP